MEFDLTEHRCRLSKPDGEQGFFFIERLQLDLVINMNKKVIQYLFHTPSLIEPIPVAGEKSQSLIIVEGFSSYKAL